MEFEIILAVAMFACAILGLLAGYSVALTLGGVALLFALIGIATGKYKERNRGSCFFDEAGLAEIFGQDKYEAFLKKCIKSETKVNEKDLEEKKEKE